MYLSARYWADRSGQYRTETCAQQGNISLTIINFKQMNFTKELLFIIIILLNISCEKKTHTIIFNSCNLESEILVPPSGCYKRKFTANGTLNCDLKLDLYMDNKKTNFVEHLKLTGIYSGKEIYSADWYENKMQLKVNPDSCIFDGFEIKVEFFD
jgi:hypothetical protein